MKLKNKVILFFVTFAFAVLFFTNKTLAANTIDVKVYGTKDYSKAEEVLQLVNKERVAKGAQPLKMDADLQEAAMTRAAEIGLYFNHTRPDNSYWYEVLPSKAYGENIALGMTSSTEVMNSWMNSDGHRKNIINASFKSIGIGCLKNGPYYYWTQVFGIKDSTLDPSKTGTQVQTFNISVLNEDLKIYARKKVNSNSASFITVGSKGSYIFGIVNKFYNNEEPSNQIYSEGVASDFTFSSNNPNVIKINSDGTFNAVAKGTATVTIALKNNPSVKYFENITVKLEPEKITGFKAQNQKKNTLEITWDVQYIGDKYEVYMYNSKKKKYKKLGTIPSNVGKVYNIESGTTYKFKVRALRYVNGKPYYGPYSDILKTTTATEKTKITKLKKAKKKLTVNWKKISKATGYQIQVATDKKFTKNLKSINISKNKTTSKKVKKLKSKKKYYVRVRTYRKVAGKKVYSGWSSVKNVKIK